MVTFRDSIQGDVSSKAKVKEFYAEIAAKEDRVSWTSSFSRESKAEISVFQIDTLVNCAGISVPFRRKTDNHNNGQQLFSVRHNTSCVLISVEPHSRRSTGYAG